MTSRAAAFLAAAAALDLTLTVYLVQGGLGPASLVLLAGSTGLATFAVLSRPVAVDLRSLWIALSAFVGLELLVYLALPYRPSIDVIPPAVPIPALAACSIGMLAMALIASTLNRRRVATVALIGIWVAAVAARIVVIGLDVPPNFDVPLFQQEAAQRLLAGQNPYAITTISVYPYGPVAAAGAAIGEVFGDPRWTQAVSDCAAAAGLFLVARRALGGLVGTLLGGAWLWHGSALFVIWQGFPEPLLTALLVLAAVALASDRQRQTWAAGVLMGLAAATKQFGVLATGFTLVRRGHSRRAGLIALTTGVAVSIPFFLADAHLFVQGTVGFHASEPPRAFALNLLPLLEPLVPTVPPALAAITGGVLGTLVAVVSRRRPTSWIEATIIGLITLCVLGGISFVNYYVVPLALLLFMLAVSEERAVAPATAPGADPV